MDGTSFAAVYWVADRRAAHAIMRDAEDRAVGTTDEMAARCALITAAKIRGIPLTPHDVVVARAEYASGRVNARLQAAMRDMKPFHREYQRRRKQASAAGHTFIPFAQAKTKLRRVLIRRLCRGDIGTEHGLFDEVFGNVRD